MAPVDLVQATLLFQYHVATMVCEILYLAAVLCYYATRESYRRLCFTFQVPCNTITCVLREVSNMILDEYQDEVFDFPTNPKMWEDIVSGLSADGTFIMLVALLLASVWPASVWRSPAVYYNYKGFYSISLLGLVNADYKFIWDYVGANGLTSKTILSSTTHPWDKAQRRTCLVSPTLSCYQMMTMMCCTSSSEMMHSHCADVGWSCTRVSTRTWSRVLNYRQSFACWIVEMHSAFCRTTSNVQNS